jgi:hypothetical protein
LKLNLLTVWSQSVQSEFLFTLASPKSGMAEIISTAFGCTSIETNTFGQLRHQLSLLGQGLFKHRMRGSDAEHEVESKTSLGLSYCLSCVYEDWGLVLSHLLRICDYFFSKVVIIVQIPILRNLFCKSPFL